MIKYIQSKSFKMALSATIAILISNYIGLNFGVTSGIIAILSIQDTKKESLIIGGRRFLAAVISILLSFGIFKILGNNPITFGVFLIIYIPITAKLKIIEGMVPSAVLASHLLSSTNIDSAWIVNEIKLTIIGIGVAMIFNLYNASLEEDFEKNREEIEEDYRLILSILGESLIRQELPEDIEERIEKVENLIMNNKIVARRIYNNYLLKTNEYYTSYMDMRFKQLETIKRMKKHFSRFYMQTYDHTRILSKFTKMVASNLREDNDCLELIEMLELLRKDYKDMDLPQNRDEFENRALLYQFLNDLEDFLNIKKEFKSQF